MSSSTYKPCIISGMDLPVLRGTLYGPAKYLSKEHKRFRRMNKEEFDRYKKKVVESQGFDVDGCTGCLPGGIVPINPSAKNTEWRTANLLAKFAASEYKGKDLKVSSLLKANRQPVRGVMYYLTFTAEHTFSKEIKSYRAKVILEPTPDKMRLVSINEYKPPEKTGTPLKAGGSMSESKKISKTKKGKVLQAGGSKKISKTKKGKVLQAGASMSGSKKISKTKMGKVFPAGGVLPGFTALLRWVKSQNSSMTHNMAREVASKKWKLLSNAEKQSFIYEGSRK